MKVSTLREAALHAEAIRELHLRNTSTRGLAELLPRLPGLTRLSIERCRLTLLPETIARCTQLEYLSLVGNQLVSVPEALSACSHLRSLDLSANRLATLPETLSACVRLRQISLKHNQFTDLPAFLCRLPWLAQLDLSHNYLQALPEDIAPELLEQLNLSHNHLEGLSARWLSLPRFKSLDIRGNPFIIKASLLQLFLSAPALTSIRGLDPSLQKKLLAFMAAKRKTKPVIPQEFPLFAAFCGDEEALHSLSPRDCLLALKLPLPALRPGIIRHLSTHQDIPSGARVAILGQLPLAKEEIRQLSERLSFSLSGMETADWIVLGGPPYRIPAHIQTAVCFVGYQRLMAEARAAEPLDEARIKQLWDLLTHSQIDNRRLAVARMLGAGIPERLLTATLYAWLTATEPGLKRQLRRLLVRYTPESDQGILKQPMGVWKTKAAEQREILFRQALQGTAFDAAELCQLLERGE
jgi:hypothetical protein